MAVLATIAACGACLSLTACDGGVATPDAGPAREWMADCMEVGPPGDTIYRAVCRDGDLIAAFCETDGGLEVCARLSTEPDVTVAAPRCERTATVVCNEGSPTGPRLEEPVCLDDSEPSCVF